MVELVKIWTDFPKRTRNFVVCRTRGVTPSPLFTCEPYLTAKNSASFANVSRESVLSECDVPPFVVVFTRPWSILNLREAFSVAVDVYEFRTWVLAESRSAVWLKVYWLISTWSRCKIVCFWFLVYIDSFRPERVLLFHACLHLVFILYEWMCTLPGPGLRCIWGAR